MYYLLLELSDKKLFKCFQGIRLTDGPPSVLEVKVRSLLENIGFHRS